MFNLKQPQGITQVSPAKERENMKKLSDILTRNDKESFYYPGITYSELLDGFEYEIVVQVDDKDYQGDSRLLFKDGDRFGYLNFGWGSCSGCDALEGCSSFEEVEKLYQDLYESIRWFDNAKECLDFFEKHDWEGDYSWYADEQKQFINECKEKLKARLF